MEYLHLLSSHSILSKLFPIRKKSDDTPKESLRGFEEDKNEE